MGPGKAYSKPFRHVSLLPRAGVYRRWRHHRRLCFGPWRFLQAFFFLIGASERFIVLRTCPGYSQSLLVGFQTEITPFSSIDGVGHQSLSLGKTLSVLSLSLSIESPRCQDLLVWSFFLFSRSFSYNLPRVPFVFPQRGTGTLCSTFMWNCILFFFSCLWDVFPHNTFILKRELTCILEFS